MLLKTALIMPECVSELSNGKNLKRKSLELYLCSPAVRKQEIYLKEIKIFLDFYML